FQAEDGIRDATVTGVQTCALPIFRGGCGAGRIKEKLCGERSSTMMCCGCCTTRPMQEPMFLDVRARQRPPMEKFILPMCLAQNRSEERRVGKDCRCRCEADEWRRE